MSELTAAKLRQAADLVAASGADLGLALDRLVPDLPRPPRIAVNSSLDDPKADGLTHGMWGSRTPRSTRTSQPGISPRDTPGRIEGAEPTLVEPKAGDFAETATIFPAGAGFRACDSSPPMGARPPTGGRQATGRGPGSADANPHDVYRTNAGLVGLSMGDRLPGDAARCPTPEKHERRTSPD